MKTLTIDGDRNGGTEPGINGVQLQLLNADGSVYDSDPTYLHPILR
ncbi:MAG: hypothetical protein R2795_18605 [Saprospiraceae bacterium]